MKTVLKKSTISLYFVLSFILMASTTNAQFSSTYANSVEYYALHSNGIFKSYNKSTLKLTASGSYQVQGPYLYFYDDYGQLVNSFYYSKDKYGITVSNQYGTSRYIPRIK
jgi:hypothetical protein